MMPTAEPHRRVHVEHIMGTAVSIHLLTRSADDEIGQDAITRCFAELREIDRVFSTYREDSDISRLRRAECGITELDPRVA